MRNYHLYIFSPSHLLTFSPLKSVCRVELVQEAHIVLGEQTQVGHLVFQVGDALDAEAEGVTAVNLAVYAAKLKHVGVDHAAPEDFHPSRVFAETAAFASADVTRYVHFRARLGEWEVAWAQADFSVGAEQFACERQENLLQVGERHVLVDVKSFDLMEEAVRARRDGLVSVNASRADDADWRLCRFHDACLYGTCVAAQDYVFGYVVGVGFHEERVLHVACRMVGCEVHLSKYVQVVLHFGPVGEGEAHAREDVYYFVLDYCERMACAELDRIRRARKVDVVAKAFACLALFAQRVDAFKCGLLEFVDFYSDFLFLFRRNIAEVGHKSVDFALFTKVF